MNDPTCWPDARIWKNFNDSIDGQLILVHPTAMYCAHNTPNIELCNISQIQWTNSTWRADQAGSMQNSNWENVSCSDETGVKTCNQGSVPRLGVNALIPDHVIHTVQLASLYNLRLVIKSTGHDYLGRSTATDSLLLWLHNMKSMSLEKEYRSCKGESISNAIRVSAGVQWGEIYTWLSAYNLTAIGGVSSTVGVIGGYLQGGGHGPLSRWKGMAADQVLEFDVVTADGQRRKVDACENPDLFWALRGGGGQTFAVVLSAVLRTYPTPTIVSATVNMPATDEVRYVRLIRDFIRYLPSLSDVGYSGYFYLSDFNLYLLFFVPNGNFSRVTSILDDFIKNNTDLRSYSNFTLFSTFYEYFSEIMQLSSVSGGNLLFGSRLIPEKIVYEQPDQLADVLVRIRGRTINQSVVAGHFVAGGEVSKIATNNSVNPGWRSALMQIIYSQGWNDNTSDEERQRLAAHLKAQIELLETVAGGTESTCYLNEADPNEPNWQQKFFGSQEHYSRLKSVKTRVDPQGLFICKSCVGSDDWSDDLNCLIGSVSKQQSATSVYLFLVMLISRLLF